MNCAKKLIALALTAALSLTALAGCAKKPAPDFTNQLLGIPGSTVVATAENVEITAEELMVLSQAYTQQNMQYMAYFGMDSESMWQMPASEDMSMSEYIRTRAMEEAAYHKLVRYYAAQEGIKLTAEDKADVEAQMAEIAATAKESGKELEEYLNLFFMTGNVLRMSMESDKLYMALAKKYFDEGTEGYPTYESLKAELEATNAYTVKHILLATVDTNTRQPLDEATAQQKKEQAQQLVDQLKASTDLNADFDKLMRQYSEDPGLVTNPDGYTFTDADTASLDPAFDTAAKALAEGEMSGIVEGMSGYHIILRMPLAVDVEARAETFSATKMGEKMGEWINALDIQLNETGSTMDPKDMYDKAMAFVMAESGVEEEADQPDTSVEGDTSAEDTSAADTSSADTSAAS